MRQLVIAGSAAVALFAAARAEAQSTFERAWIDVNFGVALAAEDTFVMRTTPEIFEEPADFRAEYSLPRGAAFDFGGGVMITPIVGVGVSFSGTAHEDPANLSARVPHPIFFNTYASDAAETEDLLQRVEGGVHLQVMAVAAQTDRVRFRVFGGPTRFRVEQDAVADIRYDQTFLFLQPVNEVEVTGFDSERIEGSGWGFHAGADVSFFFSRVVGVGGFARFSRGNVDLENTLANPGDNPTVTVTAGGFQVGGGLRLKF